MAACKFCGKDIDWEKDGERWVAYNQGDDSRHYCDRSKPAKRAVPEPVQQARLTADPTVVHISADQWDELVEGLARIEELLKHLVMQPAR